MIQKLNPLQKALHQRALKLAQTYQKTEVELVEIFQKIIEKKVYIAMGYSNIYRYAVSELKLSEDRVYNFLAVTRKIREIPEIKSELKNGNLTVSKVRKVTSVITPQNACDWLEKAKVLSKNELEKAVAMETPKAATPERAQYVSESRLNLHLGVEEDLMKKLRRAQDLVSQKLAKPASLEDTLDNLVSFYLERKDPVLKAKRIMGKKKTKQNHDHSSSPSKNEPRPDLKSTAIPANLAVPGRQSWQEGIRREPIPSTVRHAVYMRDQGRCAHRNAEGIRCDEKRWLDLHHRVPVCEGGTDHLDNIITLCKTHHRLIHQDRDWDKHAKKIQSSLGFAS